MKFPTKLNRREIFQGGIYLIFFTSVMPWLVPLGAHFLAPGLDAAQVNFVYFLINFLASVVIFRKFLFRSLSDALTVPGPTLWYALMGYLGTQALGDLLAGFILHMEPGFANVNDAAITALVGENFLLMGIGTVVLAPIAEELLFRGLIFRSLFDRNPRAAYLASMAVFSAIHITGYVGTYEPKLLALCFLQYLPAAYCLNFAYRRSGTIAAPILAHMLVNLMALLSMR